MADALKVEIVARDFNRMLEELAAIDPRVEFRQVCLGVAERVVAGAMRATRAAAAGRIRADYDAKEYTTFNGKRYRLTNRFPDALWREISSSRRGRLSDKLKSRGLSKQSWLWVAESFGARLSAPAYVSAASYKGRQFSEDGSSSEAGSSSDFALTVVNSSPIVSAAGGRSALLRAMRGETLYFRRNMEARAFATLESRVAKYPQIFARQG